MQASSSGTSRSPTPDLRVCTREPPSSSCVTSSPTAARTRCGPASAIDPRPLTIGTKSARPGMYAVPAAHGPISAATCGITPEAMTSSRNRWPEPANGEPTASWMRAPAESSSQTIGIRLVSASSRSRVTFSSPVMPIEPAMTVKSYAQTATSRPSTFPYPVITPSAGASRPAMAACEKCGCAWMPNSQKVPSSISRSSRSRAVSLPWPCCLAILSSPPPSFARSRRAARSSTSGRSRPAGCSVVDMGLLEKRFQGADRPVDVFRLDVHLHAEDLGLVGDRFQQVVELVGADRLENVAVEVDVYGRRVDRVLHCHERVQAGAHDGRAAALDVLPLGRVELSHARQHDPFG